MLDLFGSGYVIDHCVSAFLEYKKEDAFRIYVTDALKAYFHLNQRYEDWFKPQDIRTSEEIITSIKDKLARLGGEE